MSDSRTQGTKPTEHSPFPWHVEPTRNNTAWLLVDCNGEKVALANCTDNAKENMEAIANMTAAPPSSSSGERPCPPYATDEGSQRLIDIKNLRTYALWAKENDWHVECFHWSVIEHTLNSIADRLEAAPSVFTEPRCPKSIFHFDRYRNGIKMAEGARVRATNPEEALQKARDLFIEDNRDGKDEFRARPSGDGEQQVECAARKAGTAGGNYPQDCDWPFCGCDPKAEKVISALVECGWRSPKEISEQLRRAELEIEALNKEIDGGQPAEGEAEKICFACGLPDHLGGCVEAYPEEMRIREIFQLEKRLAELEPAAAQSLAWVRVAARKILEQCAARFVNPQMVHKLDPQSVIDKQIENAAEIILECLAAPPPATERTRGREKAMNEIKLSDCSCFTEITETGEVISHHEDTCVFNSGNMSRLFVRTGVQKGTE